MRKHRLLYTGLIIIFLVSPFLFPLFFKHQPLEVGSPVHIPSTNDSFAKVNARRYSMPLHSHSFAGKLVVTWLPINHGYRVELTDTLDRTVDELLFTKPIFRLCKGDIDRDGNEDILLGIVKKTRFDPVDKKRLSIFFVDSSRLRPLFLCSRTIHELVDFAAANGKPGIIYTIEKISDGRYVFGTYSWCGFGLSFKGYLKNYSSLSECTRRLARETF